MSENNIDALNEQYGESSFGAFKDARDVDKAFDDWYAKGNTGLYTKGLYAIRELKSFATYYAQRCGVDVDGECEHPYHSIVGGNGSPERCLKCGKLLSD
ncbi:MAG: hypothetical protein GX163_03290 [Bacteroidetes bacterium]|nr:hypothetical protein [Bacteroidota bacterium]